MCMWYIYICMFIHVSVYVFVCLWYMYKSIRVSLCACVRACVYIGGDQGRMSGVNPLLLRLGLSLNLEITIFSLGWKPAIPRDPPISANPSAGV